MRPLPRHEFVPHKLKPEKGVDIPSKSTLGSGSEVSVKRSSAVTLTYEQVTQLEERKLGIFVYGRIDYRDVFKNTRFTNFRYIMIGDGSEWALAATEEGNETT
jgi:hypothetical protein